MEAIRWFYKQSKSDRIIVVGLVVIMAYFITGVIIYFFNN